MRRPRLKNPLGAPGLRRLFLMCMLVGIVAGLGAAGFFALLEAASSFFLGSMAHYHPLPPGQEQPLFQVVEHGELLRWVLLFLPAVGGLLSGIVVFTLAPEAEGHGTDAAIEAYHYRDGRVRKRVPLVKSVASALTIGTGGSGGREGPIAQIGSGFASTLAAWLGVSAEERRVLMASGLAAGVGAIFHAPLAGALFGAEVLYSGPDMEHEVFVPAFVTSIVAYSVFGAIFGFHPLFVTPAYTFTQPMLLLPYAGLGLISAAGGWLYVKAFYGVRHIAFHRLAIPDFLKPMLGGVGVGLIGFCLPEALASGYGVVQACFNQDTAGEGLVRILDLPTGASFAHLFPSGFSPLLIMAAFLAVIGLAKIATTALAIGTGGSGGVFGPAVVIGGALGGATGLLCQYFLPALDVQPGAFAVVGMAGFFAGAAKTPISTIIMVSEMTGNYDLLVPAMLVCIIAFTAERKTKLYEKQLPSRVDAPSKMGYMARAILRRLTVQDVLDSRRHVPELVLVPAEMPFSALRGLHYRKGRDLYPVIDHDGNLTGVVDDEELRNLIPEHDVDSLLIADDMQRPATTVTPHESILAVVNLMAQTPCDTVVVLEGGESRRPTATLSRSDVIEAYNRQITVEDL
jgi:CIC family chloride channel protein